MRSRDAVAAAFVRIVEMPGIGTLRPSSNRRLSGLRMWPVPGFSHYLIFCRPAGDAMRIVRILHSAQGIRRIMARESGQ